MFLPLAADIGLVGLDWPRERAVVRFERLAETVSKIPSRFLRDSKSRWSFILDTPFRLVETR